MKKRRIIISLFLALTILLSPIISYAAPYTADTYYEQPKEIVEEYFKAPKLPHKTPGIASDREGFTTHEEMMELLSKEVKNSKYMTMRIIGESQEGRKIPIVILDKNGYTTGNQLRDTGKPVVWLQAQIHGNEPAASEGALQLLKDFSDEAFASKILDKISIVILPRFNVDGSYYFQRPTAMMIDCNRDHLKFDIPESIIVHKTFNEFTPEVVIDLHEYSVQSTFSQLKPKGALTYYDLLISSAKNLNIPEEVRKMSDSLFVKAVEKKLDEVGISNAPYYTTKKNNDDTYTLTEAGKDAKIGRNAYGLSPSFSFLIETRGIGIGRENFERRVYSQYIAAREIIVTAANNAKAVKDTIVTARKNISKLGTSPSEDNVIVLASQDKLIKDHPFKVIDLETKKIREITVDFMSTTEATPIKTRTRPTAYILPPAYHDIAKKLSYSGVNVRKLDADINLDVETYKITNSEVETRYYEGHYRNTVTVDVLKENVKFLKGSYVFIMNQPQANIIALSLEPDAEDSFVKFNFFPVNVGNKVPIYRYMGTEKLNASIVKVD